MRNLVSLCHCFMLLALIASGCIGKATTPGTDAASGLGSDVTPTTDTGSGVDGKNGDIAALVCVGKNDKHACDTFDECASGEYCDPCSKTCKKSRALCDPCETAFDGQDAECAGAENGSICIPYATGGNYCGQVCLGNAGCPPTFTCKAVNGSANMQCVPKNGSCAPGSGQCKTDGDCPFQFICNPDYGACVKGCTTDLSCPQAGTTPDVCSLGHCVTPCSGDAECTTFSAEAKCLDFHCKIPGGCMTSAECAAEQHCALTTHKCVPGCQVDSDCQDASKSCDGSACVVKGCQMNYDCAYGEVCDAGTGKCGQPTLPYCGACDDQGDDHATLSNCVRGSRATNSTTPPRRALT